MRLKGALGPIARRYARALLDVASAGEPDQPAEVRLALESASALLARSPELAGALAHPAVPADARKRVASAVWAKAPEVVKRLVHLLIDRDRVALLPAVAAAYAEAWNASRGFLSAEAASAVALDPGQEKALREGLERATGLGVELLTRVDPDLIGGLRVTLGGRTIDGSVKSQLEALRRSLRGAA